MSLRLFEHAGWFRVLISHQGSPKHLAFSTAYVFPVQAHFIVVNCEIAFCRGYWSPPLPEPKKVRNDEFYIYSLIKKNPPKSTWQLVFFSSHVGSKEIGEAADFDAAHFDSLLQQFPEVQVSWTHKRS